MIEGYIFSFLTGFLFGLQGFYGKVLSSRLSTPLISWGFVTFPIPLLFVMLLFSGKVQLIFFPFLMSTLISFLVNYFCWYMFFKALREAPIYQTMPYTAFTQIFLIPVAYFWLKEKPDALAIMGIFLIFAGGYGIHLSRQNVFEPIKSLFKIKGTRMMLLVAFLWSISATAEKVAVLSSSQAFYGTVISVLLSIAYLTLIFRHEKTPFKKMKGFLPQLTVLGVISGLTIFFQLTALKYLFVSYVIAFKRSGIIISVLLGILFLKENKSIRNLICAVMMTIGVFLILW